MIELGLFLKEWPSFDEGRQRSISLTAHCADRCRAAHHVEILAVTIVRVLKDVLRGEVISVILGDLVQRSIDGQGWSAVTLSQRVVMCQ